MGKKKTSFSGKECGRHHRRQGREIRTQKDIETEQCGGRMADDGDAGDEIEYDEAVKRTQLNVTIAMWEFGQNDPKRDSGSKLCRLGYAKKLRVGQGFPGIVLSSEASDTLSPADTEIIKTYGIAGINCSWNRLSEIPFGMLGRARLQRKLPLLVAANTVNYGKAFKMNTAEALAASLYIVGLKAEAHVLMEPLSYGSEFLRLNFEALEAYSGCTNSKEVEDVMAQMVAIDEKWRQDRQRRKDMRSGRGDLSSGDGDKGEGRGYMDDMDLPPRYESESENESQSGNEGTETELDAMGNTKTMTMIRKEPEPEPVDDLCSDLNTTVFLAVAKQQTN